MRQPDFQKLFFDYFGRVPRKVTYSVRQDSNQDHDLVFLRSIIHDARFTMSGVSLRGKRLTISINRDCWELGLVKRPKGLELHTADSCLTISPVRAMEWRVPQGLNMAGTEFWIGNVWLEHETSDEVRDLVIDGHGWRCVVTLGAEDIGIRLSDRQTPFLYSAQRNRKANQAAVGTSRRAVPHRRR